jgi:hypothetical protein
VRCNATRRCVRQRQLPRQTARGVEAAATGMGPATAAYRRNRRGNYLHLHHGAEHRAWSIAGRRPTNCILGQHEFQRKLRSIWHAGESEPSRALASGLVAPNNAAARSAVKAALWCACMGGMCLRAGRLSRERDCIKHAIYQQGTDRQAAASSVMMTPGKTSTRGSHGVSMMPMAGSSVP